MSPEIISEVVNALFWASLRKEEGVFVKVVVHVTCRDPEETLLNDMLLFRRPVPFTVENIVKLSAGLSQDKTYIIVWPHKTLGLHAHGIGHSTDNVRYALGGLWAVFSIEEPGHVSVDHDYPIASFIPGARPIRRDFGSSWQQIIPDILHRHHRVQEYGNYISHGVSVEEIETAQNDTGKMLSLWYEYRLWDMGFHALSQLMFGLSRYMQRHRRGGAVIFTPRGDESWRDQIAWGYEIEDRANIGEHYEKHWLQRQHDINKTLGPEDRIRLALKVDSLLKMYAQLTAPLQR